MEINLFKHHYFVILTLPETWLSSSKEYTFIYCRAKDIEETIMSKFPEGTRFGIDTITKLD